MRRHADIGACDITLARSCWRTSRRSAAGRQITAAAPAWTILLALWTSCAFAAGIGYLAPPGVPASEFRLPLRPVSDIVSPSRSAEEQRDALDENGEIARLLELRPGMTVADVGAGSGYHTVRLAARVGPAGSVIAEDVRRDYLVALAERSERLGLTNVRFALGEPHDPRLPALSLDAAILVHMYHEIEQPYAFLYNLIGALRPGARVGIVDHERPTSEHGTPLELLRCELRAVGYSEIATHQLAGDGGYLAIFSPPAGSRKSPADIACSADKP